MQLEGLDSAGYLQLKPSPGGIANVTFYIPLVCYQHWFSVWSTVRCIVAPMEHAGRENIFA